jgi:hypothetical protein
MQSRDITTTHNLLSCIESWQTEIGYKSNGFLDWNAISNSMNKLNENYNAKDCHRLWKYIAYGKTKQSDEILSFKSLDVIFL